MNPSCIVLLLFTLVSCFDIGLVPPAPKALMPTATSIQLTFEPLATTGMGTNDILLYEISQRTIFNGIWSLVQSGLGQQSQGLLEAQIVTVHVDGDVQVSAGQFQLGLTWTNRSNGLGDESGYLIATPPIPWNADSATFMSALQQMSSGAEGTIPSPNYLYPHLQIKGVVRCDETVDYNKMGYNGFELGLFKCPYAGQGGFSWMVFFQSTASSGIPSLYPYSDELGSIWTGSGPTITVSQFSRGRINPTLCSLETCSYAVQGLTSATPYAFRVRALSSSAGWSAYSKTSEFVMTLEVKAPSRPRPPLITQSDSTTAMLQISQPAAVQGVTLIETQYRRVDVAGAWTAGPSVDLTVNFQKVNYIVTLFGLTTGAVYETRVRLLNAVGYSLYSTSSPAFLMTAIVAQQEIGVGISGESTGGPPGGGPSGETSFQLNSFTGLNSTMPSLTPPHPQQMPVR